MVVRPRAAREQVRDLGGSIRIHPALEQAAGEVLQLDGRLARDVGEDERPVIVVARPRDGGDARRRRISPSCGSTGPSTEWSSSRISSQASAMSVPPLSA